MSRAAWSCLAMFLLCSEVLAQAQPPEDTNAPVVETPLELQKIPAVYPANTAILPAAQADASDSEMHVVSRKAFEEFLKDRPATSDASPAPEMSIQSAEYTATLSGEVLSGELLFRIKHHRNVAGVISLAPCNLFLTNLHWPHGEAAWGVSEQEQPMLFCGPQDRQLAGEWSLRGKHRLSVLDFELHLPASLATRLNLLLPASLALRTMPGVLVSKEEKPTNGQRRWSIDLGRSQRIRFQIIPDRSGDAESPPLVSRLQRITVRPEGLDFSCDLKLQSPGGTNGKLRFPIPQGIQIASIILNGELSIVPRVSSKGQNHFLEIDLGEVRSANAQRLRIVGFQPASWNQIRALPLLFPQGAVLIDDQITLHIARPLSLRSHHITDLILSNVQLDSSDSELWVFEGTGLSPSLKVEISVPAPMPTLSFFSHVDYTQEIPVWDAVLDLAVTEGALYTLGIRVPANWQVISVHQQQESRQDALPFEQIEDAADQESRLIIQFPDPVIPASPQTIRIQCAGKPQLIETVHPLPSLTLIHGRVKSHLVRITPPKGFVTAVSSGVRELEGSQQLAEHFGALDRSSPAYKGTEFDVTYMPASENGSATLQFESSLESVISITTGPTAGEASKSSVQPNNVPTIDGLRLLTWLAPPGERFHVHSAQFSVSEPFDGVLMFALPKPARLVGIEIDDKPADMRSTGMLYRSIGPVQVSSSIVIQYRTPASGEFVSQKEVVQVPEWPGITYPFQWQLFPEINRTCVDVDLPFAHVRKKLDLPWQRRLLGPLGRVFREERTSPQDSAGFRSSGMQRANDWQATFSAQSPGIRLVSAAVVPSAITFTTWNTQQTRALSWIALIGVPFLVFILRLLKSIRLRIIAPYLLIFMVCGGLLAPVMYAEIFGSAILGLLFSIGFPRRFLAPWSDVTLQRSYDGSTVKQILEKSAIIGCFLAALMSCHALVSQEPDSSESPSPTPKSEADDNISKASIILLQEEHGFAEKLLVDESWFRKFQTWQNNSLGIPSFLIRSASYQVTLADSPELEINYEVLTRPHSDEIPVILPLSGLIFESAEDCWIDGISSRVVPAADGIGILVLLPASEEANGNPNQKVSRWGKHVLKLRGKLSIEAGPSSQFVQTKIPSLPGSVAVIRPQDRQLQEITPLVTGAVSRKKNPLAVELGPVDELKISWKKHAASDQGENQDDADGEQIQVKSTARLHPLRIELTTACFVHAPETKTESQDIQLSLPEGAILTKIEPASGVELFVEYHARRPHIALTAAHWKETSEPIVEFQYQIAAGRDWRSEPLRIHGLRSPSHQLQQQLDLRAAPGFKLVETNLLRTDDKTARPSSSGQKNTKTERITPVLLDQVYQLTESDEVQCLLKAEETKRTCQSSQTVRLTRRTMEVDVSLDVVVSGHATAFHTLSVPPQFQVGTVSVLHDGAERLQGFVESPRELKLFLTRPLMGQQTIRVSGSLPIDIGQPETFPNIELQACEIETKNISVRNESGWPVSFMQDDSVVSRFLGDAEASESLSYHDTTDRLPTHLRMDPGRDAARATTTTRIFRTRQGRWRAVTIGRVRPLEAVIQTVTVRVPPWATKALAIRSSSGQPNVSSLSDGSQMLEFHPRRLVGGEFRFRLESDCPLPQQGDGTQWQTIKVTSASHEEIILLIDPEFPFRPVSATSEFLGDSDLLKLSSVSPRLIPDENARKPAAYRIPGAFWIWGDYSLSHTVVQIPLTISRIWIDSSQGLRGTTAMILVTTAAERLTIQIPEGMSPGKIKLDGRVLPAEFTSKSQMVVSLREPLSGALLEFDWKQKDWNLRQHTTIELPRTVELRPGSELVELIPESGVRIDSGEVFGSFLARIKQYEGLLDAAELISSRSLPIDSSLLTQIRSLDSRLSGEIVHNEQILQRLEAARSRWHRFQERISVDTSSSASSTGGPSLTLLRSEFMDSHWTELDPGKSVIQVSTSPLQPGKTSIVILAALLGVLLLNLFTKRGWLGSVMDRMERNPWLAVALIGLFWCLLLVPMFLGVLIGLVAIIQMIRQRIHRTALSAS